MDKDIMENAKLIAVRSLRECYRKDGIIAGIHHFNDYWARDSFLASWGSIVIGDSEIVKHNLRLFAKWMDDDGLVPRRLERTRFVGLRYLTEIHIHRKQVVPSLMNAFGGFSSDSNSLFVITAQKFLENSTDMDQMKHFQPYMLRACKWLQSVTNESGLIVEKSYSTWMDTVKKNGSVLVTNVFVYEAYKALEKISTKIGVGVPESLSKWGESLPKIIYDTFWNGEYLSDSKSDGELNNTFSVDGNLFAIYFGLVDDVVAKKILSKLDSLKSDPSAPPTTNYPEYKPEEIVNRRRMLGGAGYHNNRAVWLWQGALEAVVRHRAGETGKAHAILETMSDWVLRYKKIFETYESDGSLYRPTLWRNESPFAWNAGMFLWALEEVCTE